MNKPSRGLFLSIEGIEGVGKSTAVQFIKTYLQQAKKDFIVTREPGGTPIAEQIRQLLLNPTQENLTADTELLLMFAARAQHIANVIRPALQKNQWVVSDRFVDASFAYQGGGRKMDAAKIEFLEKWLVGEIMPDLTILLDAPAEIGLTRAKHRGPQDRIEAETMEFFDRVRAGYLAQAKKYKNRFRIIDATQPLENVQGELKKILRELIN